MTKEELEIAKAACCVGTIWDEYEGKENFDHMVGLRVKHLVELVRNYHQSSFPSDLDEAAEEYGRKEYSHAIHFWDEGLSKNKPEVMKEDFVDSFKAGAEWMAGQGETFNGYVSMKGKRSLIAIEGKSEYKFGDKVIVQIRKK